MESRFWSSIESWTPSLQPRQVQGPYGADSILIRAGFMFPPQGEGGAPKLPKDQLPNRLRFCFGETEAQRGRVTYPRSVSQ